MTRALLQIRFRALFGSIFRKNRRKKQRSIGMTILMGLLFAYLAAVFCALFGLMFHELAPAYHASGLDWLYFATAGLIALALALFGSVFATQSQLYDAKDNDLLLSMPIPPRVILLSRMIPLMVLTLIFVVMVLGPAGVVYGILVGFTPLALTAYILCTLAIPLLAQALACLLGWLLHQLLHRMNKSLASVIAMLLFFVLYFYLYSQAGKILRAMASNGQAMASTLRSWAWPLYAMGQACVGEHQYLAVFLAIAAAVFALAYIFLSVTFFRSATIQHVHQHRWTLKNSFQVIDPIPALSLRERQRFFSCPVYLTNLGFGILAIPIVAVAGLIFRKRILDLLGILPLLRQAAPLLICAIFGFLISTSCISTPSVSLEGKYIWLLKSLPMSPRQILLGKLHAHCYLIIPISMLSAFVLGIGYCQSMLSLLLVTFFPCVLGFLCGVIGLLCGLKWARLDWITEAQPCKQSIALLVTMLSLEGILLAGGLIYAFLLRDLLPPTLFLTIYMFLLILLCFWLFCLLMKWGAEKWEAL